MNCPACHLINPPETILCDCGYSFVTRAAQIAGNEGGNSTVDSSLISIRVDYRSRVWVLTFLFSVALTILLPTIENLRDLVWLVLVAVVFIIYVHELYGKVPEKVWDSGDALLVKIRGEVDRIPLSNIAAIRSFRLGSNEHVELTLQDRRKFGKKVSFFIPQQPPQKRAGCASAIQNLRDRVDSIKWQSVWDKGLLSTWGPEIELTSGAPRPVILRVQYHLAMLLSAISPCVGLLLMVTGAPIGQLLLLPAGILVALVLRARKSKQLVEKRCVLRGIIMNRWWWKGTLFCVIAYQPPTGNSDLPRRHLHTKLGNRGPWRTPDIGTSITLLYLPESLDEPQLYQNCAYKAVLP